MPYCRHCGTKMDDHQRYCMDCGTPSFGGGRSAVPPHYTGTDYTAGMDPKDIEQNKSIAGLAYFIFFLPLIACPQSAYGRFHANQALLVLLCGIAASAAASMLAAISNLFSHAPWFVSHLFTLFTGLASLLLWLAIMGLGLLGLINGFSGKAAELPVIGRARIIK